MKLILYSQRCPGAMLVKLATITTPNPIHDGNIVKFIPILYTRSCNYFLMFTYNAIAGTFAVHNSDNDSDSETEIIDPLDCEDSDSDPELPPRPIRGLLFTKNSILVKQRRIYLDQLYPIPKALLDSDIAGFNITFNKDNILVFT